MHIVDKKSNQGDLFNEICNENICSKLNGTNLKNNNKKNLFEKFILLLLFFIIFGAIVYVIGFKVGKLSIQDNSEYTAQAENKFKKYIVVDNDDYQNKIEKKIISTETTQLVSKVVDLPNKNNLENIANKKNEIINFENRKKNYTVQLVTYKGKKYANNELNFLKGLGYNAFIINSGDYSIICIEKCASESEAKKVLRKIMKDKPKRYPGAYARKINK